MFLSLDPTFNSIDPVFTPSITRRYMRYRLIIFVDLQTHPRNVKPPSHKFGIVTL